MSMYVMLHVGICSLQLSWQILTVKARKVERTISNFPKMKNNDIECILISYLNLVFRFWTII